MNKVFIIAALAALACSQPLMAETEEPQQHEQNMTQAQKEQFQKQLFDAKVAEMAYQLQMSDEQKTKFMPIYSRYNTEMRSIFRATRMRDAKDEAEKARLKMQRQQQAQTVRLKYFDEFDKVLSASQMSRLYTTEDGIQKRLRERRMEAMRNSKGSTSVQKMSGQTVQRPSTAGKSDYKQKKQGKK